MYNEYLHNIFQASIENLILSSAYCRSSKPPARLPRVLPFSTFVLFRPSFFRSSISIPDCFSFFFFFFFLFLRVPPFFPPFPAFIGRGTNSRLPPTTRSVLYNNILDFSTNIQEIIHQQDRFIIKSIRVIKHDNLRR